MSKQLTEQEHETIRLTLAAAITALQRGRVQVGHEMQRLLKDAWDIVKKPDDPSLALSPKRKESRILTPFGPGYQ